MCGAFDFCALDNALPLRYNSTMSTIDKIKEHISYMKVWLGIFVVTNIGLVGWLAEHYNDNLPKTIAAFTAIIIIATLVLVVHKKISRKIEELEEL